MNKYQKQESKEIKRTMRNLKKYGRISSYKSTKKFIKWRKDHRKEIDNFFGVNH